MSLSDRDLIDFIYAEARLLDELRFEDWLDLYTEDGHYWMPLAHGQTDARLHASLMYEDKLLLRVRVERLAGQRTFSQQPKSRCHHLLQAPTVEHDHPDSAPDQGRHVVRTAFHYVETRQDAQ
ncbi:phenylpropionate dioxygenase, partial [Achromobacter xylosoxidans]